MYTTSNEDDLKMIKVEYLSNNLEDETQLLGKSYGTKMDSRQIESSQGVIKGKLNGELRGNLECGSAQPSLFDKFSMHLFVIL